MKTMKNCNKQYEKPLLARLGNVVDLTRTDPGFQTSAAGGLPPGGGGAGTNI